MNVLKNKTTLLIVIGFLVTIALGLLSDSVHHDDDLTHFMPTFGASLTSEELGLLRDWINQGANDN